MDNNKSMQDYVILRKKYEERANEKCNSNLPYITWCIELGEKNCPQTCYYARDKLKKGDKK